MLSFKDYMNEANVYYNTGGVPFTLKDFIEREVQELNNYEVDDILNWRKKYNIKDSTSLIWVSPSKKEAVKYSFGSSEWDAMTNKQKNESTNNAEYNIYTDSDGVIIQESDDGDRGFLFIVGNK